MAPSKLEKLLSRLPSWAQKWVFGKTAHRAYLSLFDQGVISISNFLATVYLLRVTSATEVGIYAVGFSIMRFVRAVQEGLIVQPVNTFGASMEKKDFQRYLGSTLLSQLGLTAVVSGGALLFGWLLTVWGNDTAGPALFNLWFVLITWPLQEFIRRAFYTRGDVHLAAGISTVSNLARFGVMIWISSQGILTGSAGMNAIGWGAVAGLLFGALGAREYFTLRLKWEEIKSTWLENWKFGKWMLGALLSNFVALEVYPLVVTGMISFAATGVYRALENLVAAVHVILRAMDTFITPYTARAYASSGRKHLFRIVRRAYLLGGIPIILILIGAVVFTDPLMELLYAETYPHAQSGIIWLSLFYLLWYTYWPIQSALKALKRSRPVFNANLAAIISMFTLGLLAIRAWGLNGAFIGQGLNALIANIILWRAWLKVKQEEPAEQVEV
ncbi:MAG: lipopolysaccharide biosynthesis protein [Chloroflexota bacterium]